jgi:8-oxo-dGTP pyrophosphatase MutT (NUDIX family)
MGRESRKSARALKVSAQRIQVAAVCYRISRRGIHFLLVQTRSGRWIFPKGGAERDLSYAQSAALEAYEEAGVHGRIEEVPFTRYFRKRPDLNAEREQASSLRDRAAEGPVIAFLCKVTRLEPPQEANRNPTWFPAEKAKQHLAEDRSKIFAAELCNVVDRAVVRIERLRTASRNSADQLFRDGLRESHFEPLATDNGRSRTSAGTRSPHFYPLPAGADSLAAAEMPNALRRVMSIGSAALASRRILRLGCGDKPEAPVAGPLNVDSNPSKRPKGNLPSTKEKSRDKSVFPQRWLN